MRIPNKLDYLHIVYFSKIKQNNQLFKICLLYYIQYLFCHEKKTLNSSYFFLNKTSFKIANFGLSNYITNINSSNSSFFKQPCAFRASTRTIQFASQSRTT